MEEEDDFEEQLKQEKLQKIKEEEGDTKTYKDEDGTEYEWDEDKKAWFPKITEDFIAQYQMSYGTQSTDSQNGDQQGNTDQNQDYSQCYEYYQNYYSGHGKTNNSESESKKEGESESKLGNKDEEGAPSLEGLDVNSEEYAKRYHKYMSYYYGENYADYYNYYDQEKVQDEGQSKGQDDDKVEGQGQGDQKGKKRKKKGDKPQPKRDEGWFNVEEEKNTNVYVSGLPADVTDEEFKTIMNKCGLIMFDPITRKPKLKLYRDEHGNPKGDGRCCYIKPESVDLALKFLDGSDVRDSTIHVEKAQFMLKGQYDPSKKKKKLSNKEKRKFKEKQEKLFDWRPDKKQEFTRPKTERVVVLKNMFSPNDFDDDPMLINDLRDDARNECAKAGEVKFVRLYDNHPEGVITVTMKTPCEADEAIKMLNGRWFAKKKITAETWDGKTKFEIEESEAERQKRLQKWNNFLETDEKNNISGNQSAESTAGEANVKNVNSDSTNESIKSAGLHSKKTESSSSTVSEDVQNG